MKIIIDRFEGDYAVCETEPGKTINILKVDIPKEAKEGDILKKTDNGYCVEKEETEAKRKEIKQRMNRLFVDWGLSMKKRRNIENT